MRGPTGSVARYCNLGRFAPVLLLAVARQHPVGCLVNVLVNALIVSILFGEPAVRAALRMLRSIVRVNMVTSARWRVPEPYARPIKQTARARDRRRSQ